MRIGADIAGDGLPIRDPGFTATEPERRLPPIPPGTETDATDTIRHFPVTRSRRSQTPMTQERRRPGELWSVLSPRPCRSQHPSTRQPSE